MGDALAAGARDALSGFTSAVHAVWLRQRWEVARVFRPGVALLRPADFVPARAVNSLSSVCRVLPADNETLPESAPGW